MTCTGRIGRVALFVTSGWILGCGSTQSPPSDRAPDTPVNELPLNPARETGTGETTGDDSTTGEATTDETTPTPEDARVAFTQCDPEARPSVCTKEYRPVCGEVDNGVRCITTPCESTERRTFSNACMACAHDKTHGYWPNACDNPVQDAR